MNVKNITLEVSLKPFRDLSEAGIREVCEQIYRQWLPLFKDTDSVSVMFWSADGSEILDYSGRLDDTFEWAKYIGVANPEVYGRIADLPQTELSIHHSPRLYCENPPEYTYRDLKRVLDILRDSFRSHGRTVRLGTTFDPGPEFAVSSFKYQRHIESCLADTLGQGGGGPKSFICCYTELNADDYAYAGFPNGIEQGTTFGKFLGRQTRHFCADIGFDYIWFSNGFGFGLETWGVCGAIFDGETFDHSACGEIKDKIFRFWADFRAELPDMPIETRGTNLSTGMDLASDAVPLREIYDKVPGISPPVNSPWAALNGDFGVEIAGWMSHIAEIPENSGYPYRFYTHDPWFINSPWLDRYGRNPHDIYMPLAITRIDAAGRVIGPDKVNFLTIDDSYGNMPDQVPDEVIPHIKRALRCAPDAAGPVIWLYPFDEYHDMTFSGNGIEEVFFGDWYFSTAINTGFQVNTVVSTRNFKAAMDSGLLRGNIVVAPTAAAADHKVFAQLSEFIRNGGKVLFYGPVKDPDLLDLLGLELTTSIDGELQMDIGGESVPVMHIPLYSAGGIDTVAAADDLEVVAACNKHAYAVLRGMVGWVRGSNSFTIARNGRYPDMFDREKYFYPETIMRMLLGKLGCALDLEKYSRSQPDPRLVSHYSRNALYIASFVPDLNTTERFRYPEGAPVFVETETLIENGMAVYHLPKAEHLECRVFVEMADGPVKCKEACLCTPEVKRRLEISGLNNATVRFRPEPGFEETTRILLAPYDAPFVKGNFLDAEHETGFAGCILTCRNVTGKILISW